MELQNISRNRYSSTHQMSRRDPQMQNLPEYADYTILHQSTCSWEVARSQVNVEKVIGKGAFGQVAKGTATDLPSRPGQTTVAVKMLKRKEFHIPCPILLKFLPTCYYILLIF